MTAGSGAVYSLIIYTLDGGTSYYSTPLYMSFLVWFSMLLIGLLGNLPVLGKKRSFTVLAGVFCMIAVFTLSSVRVYVQNAVWVIDRVSNHRSLKDGFYAISEDYRNYDVIYIEEWQDNLLHNYWFEFGEYDEFKKIPLADFERYGIRQEDLKGRKDKQGILVYAPESCVFQEEEYKKLAGDGSYFIYEMITAGE